MEQPSEEEEKDSSRERMKQQKTESSQSLVSMTCIEMRDA